MKTITCVLAILAGVATAAVAKDQDKKTASAPSLKATVMADVEMDKATAGDAVHTNLISNDRRDVIFKPNDNILIAFSSLLKLPEHPLHFDTLAQRPGRRPHPRHCGPRSRDAELVKHGDVLRWRFYRGGRISHRHPTC